MERVNPTVYVETMAKEVIASQLIWNCLTAKNADFTDEREVRYVIMNLREKFDADRKTHNDRSYVETQLPLKIPGNIMELLIGPLAPPGSEEMIVELLRENGYPDGIRWRRSSAGL